MNPKQISILKDELGLELLPETQKKLERWEKLFKEYNAHTNLMSRGDVELLFEKHVFDSLALVKCPEFNPTEKLRVMDVGTGGGFPSVILAVCFGELEITAVDSTAKKINFLNLVKKELGLDNLHPVADRVENMPPQKTDFILSRATARVSELINFSKKHISKGTKLLLHKAKTAQEEIIEAKLENKCCIYNYTLPTPEKHSRCLIFVKKL